MTSPRVIAWSTAVGQLKGRSWTLAGMPPQAQADPCLAASGTNDPFLITSAVGEPGSHQPIQGVGDVVYACPVPEYLRERPTRRRGRDGNAIEPHLLKAVRQAPLLATHADRPHVHRRDQPSGRNDDLAIDVVQPRYLE